MGFGKIFSTPKQAQTGPKPKRALSERLMWILVRGEGSIGQAKLSSISSMLEVKRTQEELFRSQGEAHGITTKLRTFF